LAKIECIEVIAGTVQIVRYFDRFNCDSALMLNSFAYAFAPLKLNVMSA
jgi:hypothetical protein